MQGQNSLYGKLVASGVIGFAQPDCVKREGWDAREIPKGVTFRHVSASTSHRLGRWKGWYFRFDDSQVEWS